MATMLVLKGLTGEYRGQEFAVTGPAHWVLGRSRSCTLRLCEDATVSRQHCLIELDSRGVWVQDLGSLNGTHLNGTKISKVDPSPSDSDSTYVQTCRQSLADGDELRICNNVFAVYLTDVEVERDPKPVREVGSSHQFEFSLV